MTAVELTPANESATADREIVLTRAYPAPRELVWEAYTRHEHLSKWWGPRGFTTTTYEIDVRPGGAWRFTMHGPDGTDYPNRIDYQQVERPERLVWAHGTGEEEYPRFHVTVTFEPEDGGTRVTQRMVFPTAQARQAVVEIGAIELGNQTLEKLAEHLATM